MFHLSFLVFNLHNLNPLLPQLTQLKQLRRLINESVLDINVSLFFDMVSKEQDMFLFELDNLIYNIFNKNMFFEFFIELLLTSFVFLFIQSKILHVVSHILKFILTKPVKIFRK